MNYILKATLLTFLIISLSACETGFFVRDSHSHYYGGDYNQPISWGYTVGDPLLNTGYSGNFYPYNLPYGQQVIREGGSATVTP
ncbi:hypothetical protein [methanotrophic endosymbiont of Bathymodiolus puteoserpentis (Logatchev)]|jgi:hypothetical protein|uniref:hypothetical protein n=1 Tax=methanotrophic endosymbiont of Bathymodiolus puteoserpentis (Logatchev) TaxID=343235 RepID=UPI00157A5172|nr:hypothetical protein [methanotrophic endosymbiont of Bathymodiolus puteoserpentis (Logatchev)]